MILRRLTETTTLLLLSISAFAQLPSTGVSDNSGVLDGVYVQEHIPTKRVIQYAHLREADVMWSKRIWRTIDLREKQNHPLYYPLEPISDRMSLFDVMKYGSLVEGSITLYDPKAAFDDQFKYPVLKQSGESDEEFQLRKGALFGEAESVPQFNDDGSFKYDDDGNQVYTDTVKWYDAREIVKYEIKEDWFFDKQRSVMDVRIIGISPLVYQRDPGGNVIGLKNLFWLYFPECRYVFQNFFVYNPQNDAQRMSFDDLFWKRDFNSYIHKESNVYDRTIQPNWLGVDALLESEKIKGEMFRMEHDLWNL
ncbi:MAG: gliding motility protein GldN [Flavobacteriales bacterium]|nr:gliding motility protein GldN [Flavobacteriales bacterium]